MISLFIISYEISLKTVIRLKAKIPFLSEKYVQYDDIISRKHIHQRTYTCPWRLIFFASVDYIEKVLNDRD